MRDGRQAGQLRGARSHLCGGDAVSFTLPIGFRTVRYQGADQIPGHTRFAILYGPVLMAAVAPLDEKNRGDLPDFAFIDSQRKPDASSARLLKRWTYLVRIAHDPASPQDWLAPRPGQALTFSVAGQAEPYLMPYWRVDQESFTCYPVVERSGSAGGKITQLSLGQPTPAFRPACVSQRLRRFHYLFSRSDLLHGWEKGHDWINIKDVPSSLSFLSPAISCTIYRELGAIDELGEMLRKSPREGLAQMGRQAREGISVDVPSRSAVKVLCKVDRPQSPGLLRWLLKVEVLDGPAKGLTGWCAEHEVMTSPKDPSDRDEHMAEFNWERRSTRRRKERSRKLWRITGASSSRAEEHLGNAGRRANQGALGQMSRRETAPGNRERRDV